MAGNYSTLDALTAEIQSKINGASAFRDASSTSDNRTGSVGIGVALRRRLPGLQHQTVTAPPRMLIYPARLQYPVWCRGIDNARWCRRQRRNGCGFAGQPGCKGAEADCGTPAPAAGLCADRNRWYCTRQIVALVTIPWSGRTIDHIDGAGSPGTKGPIDAKTSGLDATVADIGLPAGGADAPSDRCRGSLASPGIYQFGMCCWAI